jgi:hypothetical protein
VTRTTIGSGDMRTPIAVANEDAKAHYRLGLTVPRNGARPPRDATDSADPSAVATSRHIDEVAISVDSRLADATTAWNGVPDHAGRILTFARKKFSGSYLALSFRSRL